MPLVTDAVSFPEFPFFSFFLDLLLFYFIFVWSLGVYLIIIIYCTFYYTPP